MPVEIRELVIKASIEQKPQTATAPPLTAEKIEQLKNEILAEVMNEVKDKLDDFIYNK